MPGGCRDRGGTQVRSAGSAGHRLGLLTALGLALVTVGCAGEIIRSNETAAIGNVRMVLSAQITHAAMCAGSYAPDFRSLAAKGVIPADFAAGDPPVKAGYRFRMTAVKAGPDERAGDCGIPYGDFELVAEPAEPGRTGVRYFRAKSDATIHEATRSDFSDAKELR